MSIWTHINGCIRIDGIPSIMDVSDNKMKEILGSTCEYESSGAERDACNVPCGSEGSMQYKLIGAGTGLILWTVPVWGDLRDYDDAQEVTDWFNRVTQKSGLIIRDAVLQINVEYQDPITLTHVRED